MSKPPARSLIVTPRPEGPEVKSFYGCPNGRCPTRWWPIEAGVSDRCPVCDAQGVFVGMVGKMVPDPQPGDSDGDGA